MTTDPNLAEIRRLQAEVERLTTDNVRLRQECTDNFQAGANIAIDRERKHVALTKISAIRDSIVGMQGFNFSEHAYPLVAALNEAGYDGAGYEITRANLGTLIDQTAKAEAERDAYRAMICDLLASAYPHPVEHPTMTKQWARARELLKSGAAIDAALPKEPKT